MLILRECLEDYLNLENNLEENKKQLENLGINIKDYKNYGANFTALKTAKIVKYLQADNGFYYYQSLSGESLKTKVNSYQADDIVIIDADNNILEYKDLPEELPFLDKDSPLVLDKSINPGMRLDRALDLNYVYFISSNVWTKYASYLDLARDFAKKNQLKLKDKQSFHMAKLNSKDNLVDNEALYIKVLNKDAKLNNNSIMRLYFHDKDYSALNIALRNLLELELGMHLETSTETIEAEEYYLYTFPDEVLKDKAKLEKVIARLLELFEGFTPIKAYF